jgi:hypothetical protein
MLCRNQEGDQPEQVEMETNWDQVIESFDELGLKKDLLRGKNKF